MGDAPRSSARGGLRARMQHALAASASVVLVAGAVSVSSALGHASSAVALGAHAGPRHEMAVRRIRALPAATENPSWSGELAWASKNGSAAYADVTGAWVQPAVAPSSSPEFADTWVGIDGYDGKLLQAGTTAEASGNATTYDAWFVAWTGQPSGMTVIDEPVAPGDHMQVSIARAVTGEWSVRLHDTTAGWTWSTTVTYPADGSTAEWIEEAPGTWSTTSHYQTLADYGAVTFTTVQADGRAPAAVTSFDVAVNGEISSYPGTYNPAQGTFTVRYGQPAVTLQAISPTAGPASGGTIVQLTGSDLGLTPVVRFGGAQAVVLRSSTSSIVVRTPAHAPGDVPVTVALGQHGALAETDTFSRVSFDYTAEPGYVVLEASGAIAPFGSAPPLGAPGRSGGAIVGAARGGAIVGIARDAATGGYWEVTSGGGVYDVGAPDLGTLAALVQRLSLGEVTGIAATPTGSGYWLVTANGGVFDFGAARSLGTLRATRLAAPIVGIAAAPTGAGYWLVGADGGVFTFGAARFFGSAGALRLAAPIVGIAAMPTGSGYWLVGADGGVFTFGAARFFGSAARMGLGSPIVAIAASTTGHGYWLAAADGRVLAFGAAPMLGSLAPSGSSRVVAILAG
jgi:hypothetical protein